MFKVFKTIRWDHGPADMSFKYLKAIRLPLLDLALPLPALPDAFNANFVLWDVCEHLGVFHEAQQYLLSKHNPMLLVIVGPDQSIHTAKYLSLETVYFN